MPKSKDAVVAIVSDFHVGSTTGILPEGNFLTPAGVSVEQNQIQQIIYQVFKGFLEEARDIRKGKRLVLVLNGDFIDGDHHGSEQINPRDEESQLAFFLRIAEELKVGLGWNSKTDKVVVTRGTDLRKTHGSADAARRVHKALNAVNGNIDIARFTVDGKRFQVTHHNPVSPGKYVHTRGNSYRSWLRAQYYQALELDRPIYDYSAWSHIHQPWVEKWRSPTGRELVALSTGAWQVSTDYVLQRMPFELPTALGGTLIVPAAGEVHELYTRIEDPEGEVQL